MNPRESKQINEEATLSYFLGRLGVDSAAELARRIGCNEKTIRNWGKSRSQPTLTIAQFKKLLKELEAAGLSIDEVPDVFSPQDQTQNA